MDIKDVADWPPEKITSREWRGVHSTLVRAQGHLEADGCRHSWMDAAIALAKEQSNKERSTEKHMSHGKSLPPIGAEAWDIYGKWRVAGIVDGQIIARRFQAALCVMTAAEWAKLYPSEQAARESTSV